MIDEKKLIDIIEKNCYPVQYDRNSVEHGMTLTGIMQAIEEQPKMDELEIAKKYIEHYKDERSMEIRYRIVEQPKAGEWIPVSERLPEESLNSVIGWDQNYKRCCFVQYYNGEWSYPKYQYALPEITAWMPMPEPYKEGDQEE